MEYLQYLEYLEYLEILEKTGNCRVFYILGNLIFFKSWKTGNLKSLDFLKYLEIGIFAIFGNSGKTGNWKIFYILGILKNWKLEYFANPGKLVIVIFWES